VNRHILQSYSDGVNAYLKDHDTTALSLEYAVLGLLSPDYRIEPWEPVNSLTWGKAMAWDLRGNMDNEVERAILLKTLTPEQVDALFPPYPQDHPVIVNKIGEGSATGVFRTYPQNFAQGVPLRRLQGTFPCWTVGWHL
jgi:penicillin amidase